MTAPIRDTARDQRSHHETADEYGRVVARVSDGWRVIVCKDAHQWILQRRDKTPAGGRWRAVRFHRTRDALIRSCAAFCEACDPAALVILAALPPHFSRGRR